MSPVDRLVRAVQDVLPLLKEYPATDFPRTCGACGSPFASCDTECMAAAYMADHNQRIRRLRHILSHFEKENI